MEKKTTSERLRALAVNETKRSTFSRIYDLIDDIEAALSAGVSRSLVVNELNEDGFKITLSTFENIIRRIRKQRNESPLTAAQSVLQPPALSIKAHEISPIEIAEEKKSTVGSHDPRELDKIFNSRPDMEALAKFAKRNKL